MYSYGEMNDATVQKLKSLMMRIDQDDKPGMKIVELVHDLIDGEMKKSFRRPNKRPPANRKPYQFPRKIKSRLAGTSRRKAGIWMQKRKCAAKSVPGILPHAGNSQLRPSKPMKKTLFLG